MEAWTKRKYKRYGLHKPRASQFLRNVSEIDGNSSSTGRRSGALLEPLVAKLRAHVFAGSRLHGDDTPVPVLEPGKGKTKTGRLWTFVRGVAYFYSPDRKGEHPKAHLADFSGILHADGYAGFRHLYEATQPDKPATIQEAACWAHVRRKSFDLTTSPGTDPIAEETLVRIGELYDIENATRGAGARPSGRVRRKRRSSAPAVVDNMLTELPRSSSTAEAIRYAIIRWASLCRFLDDGTIEIDNNAAERAIRPIAGPESMRTPSLSVCNIGSVSASAMRHGRVLRAITAWTVAEARSLARIWRGAPPHHACP